MVSLVDNLKNQMLNRMCIKIFITVRSCFTIASTDRIFTSLKLIQGLFLTPVIDANLHSETLFLFLKATVYRKSKISPAYFKRILPLNVEDTRDSDLRR